MNELMNYIDAIKEKITDVEYKQLCDKMMELNTQRKTTKKFYRVWYVITKTIVQADYENDKKVLCKYCSEFLNKNIQLKAETVEWMRSQIDEMGRFYVDKKILELQVGQESLDVITAHGLYDIEPLNEGFPIIRIDDIE